MRNLLVKSSELGVMVVGKIESILFKVRGLRAAICDLKFVISYLGNCFKKFVVPSLALFLLTMATSCDSENGLNCTQAAGDIQSYEVDVDTFDKVIIFQRMGATFKQGPIQKVVVKTGENLFNDIDVKVIDGQLQIVNNNGCNLVRDYGITQIEITSPNITEIRTSTGEDLKSDGVLSYPSLTLLSEDTALEDEFNTDGDFRLELDVQNLKIVSNNLSYFYLSGTVENTDITFLDGDGRIYAENLEVQNAQIFHRGTSEWRMDVKQSIAGTINGYGDVILNNQPTTVDVQETWRGRLIYLNN
ncbi:head GIN domain-containing protein [Nonlabens antarcticus]|uniref:head GIN domain-containing protein n=1 Tax=Nonlabens antarcticus TaxID=392714 RepID=UPI001E344CC6|nr:head GIN domain-containing protein [Nonlabens antarcticus]